MVLTVRSHQSTSETSGATGFPGSGDGGGISSPGRPDVANRFRHDYLGQNATPAERVLWEASCAMTGLVDFFPA